MIQLCMYKGKGLVGNALIRAWSRSPFSHCELHDTAAPGGYMSSSLMDHGVRRKQMELEPWNWIVIDLPWANPYAVLLKFHETQGQPYSWLDLLRCQLLNRRFDQKGASFCSEWCADALGLPNPASLSPQGLFDLCVYLNNRKA